MVRITDFIPPILTRGLRKIRGPSIVSHHGIDGDFKDWESAVAASTGYSSSIIRQRMLDAARSVRDGKYLWDRDSVLFQETEFHWPLLACLFESAAHHQGGLHVLDFGGALGSTWRQHRVFLNRLPECSWGIVEQPEIVAIGQQEFTIPPLHFHNDIASCLTVIRPQVFLISSVLQYLSTPDQVMKEICQHNFESIIIDRTPFHDGETDRISIQRPEHIYPGVSYPIRIMSLSKLIHQLRSNGYGCVQQFPTIDADEKSIRFMGLNFQKRNAP